MAKKLSERAVDAVVALLQDATKGINQELVLIDTARNDGVTMAPILSGDYHTHPAAAIVGNTVHCEVFEEGWEFEDPYSDANAGRALFDCPLVVRITHFNRDGDTAEEMITRMRRYMTGAFEVFNSNRDGLGTDACVKLMTVLSVDPSWEIDEEDDTKITKVRASLSVEVKIEEL